jgi:CRP-like cAMP-binding protein
MSTTAEHINRFFKDLPFFKDMKDTDVSDFIATSNLKKYTKNQVVFLHGDNAERFFIVFQGWIKLHRETPEGEESIIGLLTRGDMFGDAAIFCDAKYPFSAHCAEQAQLIEIPSHFLREKAKPHPEIMESLLSMMCHDMKALRLENEHMAVMSTPQRVGCLLLQLSSGMVGKGGTFSFPYDKSLAAVRLGMKPETFSRALAQLKPLGVAVKGSEITIDNFDELVDYTCIHCSATAGECRKADCCVQNCIKKKL